MASHQAVIVQPQQLDHVTHIGLILDSARRGPGPIGEDRMGHDPAVLPQLGPDLLREAEVGGVVAVQVTDLPATELEGELAAVAQAASTPGQEVTSAMIRWLAVGDWVMVRPS
jgi:hypothetical protein